MRSPIPYPLIAIRRDPSFSPNSVGNDARILEAVVHQLEAEGYCVHVCSEDDFVEADLCAPMVFGMYRKEETLRYLQRLEKKHGTVVVNTPEGIANCRRAPLLRIMEQHDIPQPESVIVDVNRAEFPIAFPCWMKRANGYSMEKGDVAYVSTQSKAEAALKEFRGRGIRKGLLSEHLKGDLVKFYGVVGTPFFYSFYPTATDYSKFGLEKHNGKPKGHLYDEACLHRTVTRLAMAAGIQVYGGDCIVWPDGSFRVIDFNDWPSFSPCRAEAAIHITQRIISLIPQT